MQDNPFRFANSILDTKEYQFNTVEDEQEYNAFLTNRALSQHVDCILLVNEVSQYPDLSNKMIYDFLFHMVRKMKRRYAKWPKKVEDKDIQLLADYYQVSIFRAEEYAKILTKEEIDDIRKVMES